MVLSSRALQSLATPSHSMQASASAARIQMRGGALRRVAARSPARSTVVGAEAGTAMGVAEAAVAAGDVGVVAKRLRAGSRAITIPTAAAAASVAAGVKPA